MKQLVLAAMLLGGIAGSAQAAEVVWQGDIFITAATSACAPKGFDVGSFFRSEFKPPNLGDNGTDIKLSLISNRAAQRYTLASSGFVAGTYNGTGIGGTANVFTWTSKFTGNKVTPSNVLATTQMITVTAKIATFDDIANCNVTIAGSLGLRPDL